jgi:hypothetical protein
MRLCEEPTPLQRRTLRIAVCKSPLWPRVRRLVCFGSTLSHSRIKKLASLRPREHREPSRAPRRLQETVIQLVCCSSHTNIAYRQDHENQRLHDAHDTSKCVKRHRHQHVGETGKQCQHVMVGEHIGE